MEKTKIGLFGYGVVGHGLYDLVANKKSVNAEIVKICVLQKEKRRDLPKERFSFDRFDLLDDPEIDLIVELIDDATAAFEIVTYALKKGKNVVSANKKMIAENMEVLYRLQKETGASLLYEGSCCGSIPVIRTLEEYYDNELLHSVSGIFNSSTNYILSKLFIEDMDYDIALKHAQDLGFVESNPSLDIDGWDALFKLIIVSTHSYGVFIKPDDVLKHGIQNISRYDIQYAREKGFRIKQFSMVRKFGEDKISLFVMPAFFVSDDYLFWNDYEDNSVIVEGAFSDRQYFQGKGAGSHPTGSAVLSDISANSYDYKYEFKKRKKNKHLEYTKDVTLEVYFRYYNNKNLEYFDFEKITAKYHSPEFNYVIGRIKLSELLAKNDRLNTADVLCVFTGKIFED